MAKIFIIPYWITSKLNPTFELAHRLAKAGHEVSFIGEAHCRQSVLHQGFTFTESDFVMPKQPAEKNSNNECTTCFAKLAPDLVIIDIELHKYIMTAYVSRVPIVLISTFICIWKRPGIPPPHTNIMPGTGFRGHRIGIELAWLKYRLWKWVYMRQQRYTTAGTDRVSLLRRFAREIGFPFAKEVTLYQWLIPFSYRTLPVLSLNASELDFSKKTHPVFRLVGPVVATARQEVHGNISPEHISEIEDIVNKRQHGDSEALLLCSFGAFFTGDDTKFWRELAQGLAEYEKWDVIFGLGGRTTPAALGQLPSNVYAFSWVPTLRILQHADCAVIHGGITTINECIYFGVPMVVCPMMATDQYGSSLRVKYHGLGLMVDHYQRNIDSIINCATILLQDSSFKIRVQKMRQVFHAYTTDNTAVKYIESFL